MPGRDWDPAAPVTSAASSDGASVRVVVVGVGTVGLHHALAFADAGLDVVAYDVDESVVSTYRRGVDATGAVGDDRVADSDCSFTADPACVGDADVVFVSVPTRYEGGTGGAVPAVRAAAETVGERLTSATTVVLESTVPPGATSEVFTPTLESTAGLTAGDEFAVAHSPVRLSPGSPPAEWRSRTKLVAARRPEVARDVATLYERVYDSVRVVEDTATAAASKCVENVYRDVNVALVNELASALDALDLDADAVLDAAATKWNVHRHEPGLVAGTCLPDDPRLFAECVERAGGSTPLVKTARAVNDAVPERVAEVTIRALADARVADEGGVRASLQPRAGVSSEVRGDDGARPDGSGSVEHAGEGRPEHADAPGRALRDGKTADATVLLLGLSYKPDVADLSGTQSDAVAAHLEADGVDVVGYDPLVDAGEADRVLPFDVRAEAPFEDADGVVVLVGHAAFADLTLAEVTGGGSARSVVVDVPRVFDRDHAAGSDVVYRCP